MADLRSPSTPLTVHLPAELITELEQVARYKQVSIDEVVQEACLAYSEPYVWEQCFTDWARTRG